MAAAQFPLVSVVLCVYNGERFLKEQMDSLLTQTYPNIEIIVSDDHSIDGSRSILASYANDTRVSIYYQPQNLGYLENIAFAASRTHGALICFADQDDIWLPQKIDRLYASIDDSALVYSDSELVNERAQSLGKRLSQLRRMYTGRDARGFILGNVVSGHTMMVKKETVLRSLPVPVEFYHDEWMAINAVSEGGIRYLDEVLTLYRQHSATLTTNLVDKRPPARKRQKRYEDYQKLLSRVRRIMSVQKAESQDFYENLLTLLGTRESGRFSWPLFFFLLKHQKSIFMFTKKNAVSRLVEIRKLARGENPAG